MRDLALFREEAFRAAARAGTEAGAATDPEESLLAITRILPELLGDRQQHLRPGSLKEGEKQQPAGRSHIAKRNAVSSAHIRPRDRTT